MTRRPRIDDLTSIAVPEQLHSAPDGSQIVYVLAAADTGADKVVRSLWRVGAIAGEPVRLTRGQADSGPPGHPTGPGSRSCAGRTARPSYGCCPRTAASRSS